jgi:hypothetical protein
LPATATTVIFATAFARTSKDDAGASTVRINCSSNGTLSTGTAYTPTTIAWNYKYRTITLDPSGGVQWTVARINASQWGIERVT